MLRIDVRTPRQARWGYVLGPGITAGSLAWIVVARTPESFVVGGLTITCVGWVAWVMLASRRIAGTATPAILATRTTISCPLWELAWDDVDQLAIGYVNGNRSLRALFIVPRSRTSVRRLGGARILKLDAWVADKTGYRSLRILQASVDRPLERIAADLERIAGRPLLR
jgi:hypothetical protein